MDGEWQAKKLEAPISQRLDITYAIFTLYTF